MSVVYARKKQGWKGDDEEQNDKMRNKESTKKLPTKLMSGEDETKSVAYATLWCCIVNYVKIIIKLKK